MTALMAPLMSTGPALVLAFWPLWVALAVTGVLVLVGQHVDRHHDCSWDDAPTRPGGLG